MDVRDSTRQASLLELFRSIKDLWSYLPAQTWKALRATNKELHQLVLLNATSVRLRCASHVAHLLKQHWFQLTTLNLSRSNLTAYDMALLVKGDLQLQCLDLSHNFLTPATVEQLVCGEWESLAYLNLAHSFGRKQEYISGSQQVSQDSQGAVTSCQHLATSDWPALIALNISSNNVSTTALAELVQADWPRLQDLDVSCNRPEHLTRRHNHGFIKQLAQAPWTAIQDLNLSNTRLDFEDILCLTQLQWQHLTRLNICGSLKHAAGEWVRQLRTGDWPKFRVLDISNNSLSSQSIAGLMWMWPQLQILDARKNCASLQDVVGILQSHSRMVSTLYVSCDVASAAQARAIPDLDDWPVNVILDLKVRAELQVLQNLIEGHPAVQALELTVNQQVCGYTRLCTDQISVLTGWDLHNLQELSLSNLCIGAPELVLQLTAGHWPILRHLDLSTNFLNDDLLSVLVNGKWPRLVCLNLFENEVGLRGVVGLQTADWPALTQLYLGCNNFCRSSTSDSSDMPWPNDVTGHIQQILLGKWPGITVSFEKLRHRTRTSAGPQARKGGLARHVYEDVLCGSDVDDFSKSSNLWTESEDTVGSRSELEDTDFDTDSSEEESSSEAYTDTDRSQYDMSHSYSEGTDDGGSQAFVK